jgi:hypothetical protein
MMDLLRKSYSSSPSEPKLNNSLTVKKSEKASSRNIQVLGVKKVNLAQELDDAGNLLVVEEIENLMDVNKDLLTAEMEFEDMQKTRILDEEMLTTLRTRDAEIEQEKFDYTCKLIKVINLYDIDTSYLKGMSEIVDDFYAKNPKSLSRMNSSTNSLISSGSKNVGETTRVK